ncbi:HAD family hydrolase [Eubacterium sp.]|jgi:phosphoglycolate phosphatase|uniref:HAD family hydrolase n=1 Tax=Eubacterium sp. TaxID=142586 RepID=UPI0035207157
MYNTIIFDLDGTLLNTIEDLADSVNYMQRKYGLKEDGVDTVRQHVGNGLRLLVERSVPDGQDNPQFEEMFKCQKDYYQEHCQIKTCAYPGIMELLKELHNMGIKMAIVSNKAHEAVRELNDIYFKHYIEVAIGENEEAGIKKKPAPDSVNQALKLLGAEKSEAIYVGDSEVDRATAENAGLDCISCSWGFRERSLLESLKPMAIIDKPEELLKFVQE